MKILSTIAKTLVVEPQGPKAKRACQGWFVTLIITPRDIDNQRAALRREGIVHRTAT